MSILKGNYDIIYHYTPCGLGEKYATTTGCEERQPFFFFLSPFSLFEKNTAILGIHSDIKALITMYFSVLPHSTENILRENSIKVCVCLCLCVC